jgi:protein TonB
MFEQTLMPTTRNSPWTLGASITLQSAIVGTMVLYSALHVDMLPFNNTRHLELPMPPAPPPDFIKVIGVIIEHRAGALTMPSRAFTMPARIPNGIPQIDDIGSEAPVLSASFNSGAGVLDGGVIGAFGAESLTAVTPKPPIAHTQPAKPSAPLRQGGSVMEAKILKRVIPVYPPLAKNARISGKVHLMSIIAKDGTIQKLEVLDGHPLLVGAALEAVRQWIYRPTLLNGEPVDVMAPIEVNFTLTQ